jgi:YjbE family integral membrane protein
MPLIGHLLYGIFSIVFIDLLLAGDNALVIAMAVRSLAPRERRIGTICGAAVAVVLRVGLTFIAAKLLDIQFLKLAGGLFILWIAVKVLVDATDPPEAVPVPKKLIQAVWYIVFADLTMSTDNVIAIAAASNGDLKLIIFGLALSIPFVVLSANLLATLMDRYPFTIYLGSGILGRVGAEMIFSDPWVAARFHPSKVLEYATEAVLVVALIVGGKIWCDRRRCRPHKA